MFEMDEQMLAGTAETIRQRRIADRRRADERKTPQDTEQPETPNPNGTALNEVKPENFEIPHEQVREQKELAVAELEMIRLMLRYGQEMLTEVDESTGETDLTVAGYIIRELYTDELDLQQPLLQGIFEEYKQLTAHGNPVSDMYFLQHPNPEVSSLAASFEPKYELSKIHSRNGETVKTEDKNLLEVVPKSVLAYKNMRVMMRLKEISLAMQQAESNNDTGQFETLCMQYRELTGVKKMLASALGGRIYHS
jgi:DNA primase